MSTNIQSNIFAFFLYAISCIVFYFYPTYVFLIVNISWFSISRESFEGKFVTTNTLQWYFSEQVLIKSSNSFETVDFWPRCLSASSINSTVRCLVSLKFFSDFSASEYSLPINLLPVSCGRTLIGTNLQPLPIAIFLDIYDLPFPQGPKKSMLP